MSITKENNLNTMQFRLTQPSYAQQIMKCKHDVAQKVNAFPKMSNTHMGSFRDSHKGEKGTIQIINHKRANSKHSNPTIIQVGDHADQADL